MEIYEDETLEDLQINKLFVIQKKNGFRFGIDAVLLSNFAKDIPSRKTLDLCTGSGVVPFILSAKSKADEIYGLEIQEEMYKMACRSVELNGLQDKIKLTLGDLKNALSFYKKREFDLITCNPPYMPMGKGIVNPADTKIIARHEVLCTLKDVIEMSSKLLAQRGHLVIVHKPSRLNDIICFMREYKIEPKRIRLIHKNIGSEPSLVLADGVYKGGQDLKILPPLFLYDENGDETAELKEVYSK